MINITNGCFFYNDGQVLCGMDDAYSSNSSIINQKGDSGGPVYYGSNGGAIADGIISGNSNNGNPATDVIFTPYGPDLSSQWRLVCVSGC